MLKTKIAARISIWILPCPIQLSFVFLLSSGVLVGCSGGQSIPPRVDTTAGAEGSTESSKTSKKNQDAAIREDDSDDMEDIDDSFKNKRAKTVTSERSTDGKKTGVMEDTVIVQQSNEFLGATTLKLSKAGIRLETTDITVIVPPGKEAMAYNPRNGNCMIMDAKSRAQIGGELSYTAGEVVKETSSKVGTERLAGLNCVHYKIQRVLVDKKTGKRNAHWKSDLWATKDLKLPDLVLKDCARITMMPDGLGFPVRITRLGDATETEMSNDPSTSRKTRDVILTTSFSRAKVDSGEFALLSGFRTVADEMQLTMAGDVSEIADFDDSGESKKSIKVLKAGSSAGSGRR